MTVQIAAASTALILGEECRINGQWKRGALGRDSDLKVKGKEALAPMRPLVKHKDFDSDDALKEWVIGVWHRR